MVYGKPDAMRYSSACAGVDSQPRWGNQGGRGRIHSPDGEIRAGGGGITAPMGQSGRKGVDSQPQWVHP
eukprot:8862701-Pyramimonas_sp.AAC.1